MTLHVATAGSGADLVLLHGWGMHAGLWRLLATDLTRAHRVHAVDLPGHGDSPWLAGEDLLAAWVEALDARFPGPVKVCGWSLGGALAMAWARRRPDKVTRLALIGATPCFVTRPDWPHGIAATVFARFAEELAGDARAVLARFLVLQAHSGEDERAQLKVLRHEVFARPAPQPRALAAGLDLLLATDLRAEVPRITQPVSLIQGARDAVVLPGAARWLAANLPSARLALLPGAAHAPLMSHPQACLAALQGFLDD